MSYGENGVVLRGDGDYVFSGVGGGVPSRQGQVVSKVCGHGGRRRVREASLLHHIFGYLYSIGRPVHLFECLY